MLSTCSCMSVNVSSVSYFEVLMIVVLFVYRYIVYTLCAGNSFWWQVKVNASHILAACTSFTQSLSKKSAFIQSQRAKIDFVLALTIELKLYLFWQHSIEIARHTHTHIHPKFNAHLSSVAAKFAINVFYIFGVVLTFTCSYYCCLSHIELFRTLC